ncbi:unnamed protein product [Closterium sp. NIES-53]
MDTDPGINEIVQKHVKKAEEKLRKEFAAKQDKGLSAALQKVTLESKNSAPAPAAASMPPKKKAKKKRGKKKKADAPTGGKEKGQNTTSSKKAWVPKNGGGGPAKGPPNKKNSSIEADLDRLHRLTSLHFFFKEKGDPTEPVRFRVRNLSWKPDRDVVPESVFKEAHSDLSFLMKATTPRHGFNLSLGSSLYTLATEPPQLAASAQVSASGQVAPPCSCCLLSHQTLLCHHRLGHPSLPRMCGMHSRLLISGLPRSLPPLPPSPAPPCLPCVEGRQRAAPHSSFPPTTAPLQTLHMDVWGPAYVSGQGRERYFVLVVDDYKRYTMVFPLRSKGKVVDVLIPWIHAVRLQLREWFHQNLPVLRLHSDRGGEFSSDLLRDFCRGEGILQSFTLPTSPHQNGIAERHIGLVMEVARTSMIHAAAPHFLWPFAVRYPAHQLNLWPRVSLPKTSPILHWTGEVGDVSMFWVWGSRAFVRDTPADKLSTRAIPYVFLGFPPDVPGWQFYHPTSRRVFPSQDVTFDELVPFYHLFPYRSAPPPPPPLFLAPGPPPVDPLLAQGPAPSGVSQVDPLPGIAQVEPRDAEPGGAEPAGVEPGGAEPECVEPGGAESGGAEPRAAGVGDTGDTGAGGAEVADGAGGTGVTAAAGHGGARTEGTGAAGTGGVGGTGAGDPTEPGAARAGGTGAEGTGVGGAGAGGARAGDTGSGGVGAGCAGAVDLELEVLALGVLVLLSQPPLQPASPLPAPSPFTEQSGGLTERREPASCPVSRVFTARHVPRSRTPLVPSMHTMALRPSSVPLRVPLLPPPKSSLPVVHDPESDLVRAASPISASPPSVGGECALGTDIHEDRQEDFECLAAAVPHLVAMLLALEGDPDAPDIPTPRTYAEAITGPYSSQWQVAMDAEMASWKSRGTYVDPVPPSWANIVDGQ